ncbi:response regulator [Methanoregula sp.]|uniref:response regulator n=1 Tax=Methanoregula sp. TaxID=2052170 RepID=UPI00236A6FE1|nr:response regulator [Methanoregula sp.]MDD1685831.1 PAS domain S-box protein [Methanoregula sp.]
MDNNGRREQGYTPTTIGSHRYTAAKGNDRPAIAVLYVDDEPVLHEPTKISLEKRGHITVDTAGSAKEALEKLKKRSYDIIVSDYQMPEMDGIALLKHLRESGNTIPFIIFTGKGREDAVIEAYNAGADSYLAKGGNPKAMLLDLTHKIEQTVTRHRAEKALIASEEKYRTLADFLPVMVFEADRQENVRFANRLTYPTFGIDPSDVEAGISVFSFVAPEECLTAKESLLKLFAGEERGPQEYTLMRKDGSRFPAMIRASAIVDANTGIFSGFRGVIIDLTERKQKEEALRQSETSYHGLFNAVKDGIWILDAKGLFLDANPGAGEMFGYPHEFFSGDILDRISAPGKNDLAHIREIVDKAFTEGPQQFEFWAQRETGDIFLADVRLYKGTYFGKDAVITLVVDITDRKRAEDALQMAYTDMEQKVQDRTRELSTLTASLQTEIAERNRVMEALTASEEKYRSLVEQLGDIVFHIDQNGHLTYISPHVLTDMGVDQDNFQKINVYDLAPLPYLETIRNYLDPMLPTHGQVSGFELELPMTLPGKGTIYEINATPTYDKHGDYSGYSGIARDITERKNLQNKVDASLKEKEILLKEIHHRVKNNMQVISSLLNLQVKLMKDEKSRDALLESQTRVMSIALVHEKLYQSKSFSEIDYSDYLKKISENLLQSYGVPRGKIQIVIHADNIVLPISKAIPISLIINELLSNSLKYAFPGERKGVITVELKKTRLEYSLVVRDNGVGLPGEIDLDNIETLGLQLVNSLVGQILGSIVLDRTGGTEFRIGFSTEPAGGDQL